MTHYIQAQGAQLMPTLSYQRLHTSIILNPDELAAKIKRTATNTHDAEVLLSFITFNNAVLKTKCVFETFTYSNCQLLTRTL